MSSVFESKARKDRPDQREAFWRNEIVFKLLLLLLLLRMEKMNTWCCSAGRAVTMQLLLVALLSSLAGCFMIDAARTSSRIATAAVDIEALKQLKAAIQPSTIPSSSCLASWDFSKDPCRSRSSTFFVCGIRCNQANPMRVTEITLDNVGYRGTLPPYIGNVSALQLLDVSGNAFQGSIPASFGQLASLLKLEASGNSLSGWIPESLGSLSHLQYLSLAENALEGPIPRSLNRLPALERLCLYGNRLTGEIPPMNGMVSLLYFDGSSNQLSGWLPMELPSSLMEISLRKNRFQGRLPKSLSSSLTQLEVLDLSHNELTGPVEASLFTLPSLQQLNLAYNHFDTLLAMPSLAESEQAAADSQLVEIDLSFNQFQGALPVFFVRMKRVTALSLGHNHFSGLIPIEYALKSVAMLIGAEPLMRLYLDANFLAGELPSPFLSILPGQLAASFVGNCLQSCPMDLFFCQGGQQRPPSECRKFLKSLP